MKRHIYVGTYTNENEDNNRFTGSKGIYHLLLNTNDGTLQLVDTALAANPSFVELDRKRMVLYAASEVMAGDAFLAFSIDPATGALKHMATMDMKGDWACQLSVSEDGHYAAVSHYWSGSLTLIALNRRTGIPERIAYDVRHSDASGRLDQRTPRVHSTVFSKDGKNLYAIDLGLGVINTYMLQPVNDSLKVDLSDTLRIPGGAPRYLTFANDGRKGYLLTESDACVHFLNRNPSTGRLDIVQRASATPHEYTQALMGSDIHLRRDEKYLYAANRGPNTIACFAVDEDGMLSTPSFFDCGGNWPRSFCIDEKGEWMLVANQFSEEVVVYQLNSDDGLPEGVTDRISIPRAACVQIF